MPRSHSFFSDIRSKCGVCAKLLSVVAIFLCVTNYLAGGHSTPPVVSVQKNDTPKTPLLIAEKNASLVVPRHSADTRSLIVERNVSLFVPNRPRIRHTPSIRAPPRTIQRTQSSASSVDIPTPAELHMLVDPPPLRAGTDTTNLDLIIVYSGLIYPKRQHWLELLSEQLDDFNCNGMAQRAKHFHILLTIDRASVDYEAGSDEAALELVKNTTAVLTKIIPKAVFSVVYENQFEYPAIRQLWDVASSLPQTVANNTIMVYLHSKGMVNTHMSPSFHGVRTPFEVNLFHKTFDPWPEVFAKFNKHPELNKAGCYTDWTGVVWYNVFYARASYIRRLIEPMLLKDRYFYELWLRLIDGEREPSTAAHVVKLETNVRRKIVNSFCADCWSTCAQNDTLGVTFDKDTLHIVEHPKLLNFDWYKCRNKTVLPRPLAGKFSKNTQEHI